MNTLPSGYMAFEASDGNYYPCNTESVLRELLSDNVVDSDIIECVSDSVEKYFRFVMKKDYVSIYEFSEAVKNKLINLGFEVAAYSNEDPVTIKIPACPRPDLN